MNDESQRLGLLPPHNEKTTTDIWSIPPIFVLVIFSPSACRTVICDTCNVPRRVPISQLRFSANQSILTARPDLGKASSVLVLGGGVGSTRSTARGRVAGLP